MAPGKVRSQFYYHHKTIILIGGLIALYLFTRMAFILRLPPFVDEATHILWARDMLDGNITAGAYDGRWATIQIFALASLLPFEPLLIARFVAILAGLFTMLAIVFTGRDLFSENDGFVAGFLYVVIRLRYSMIDWRLPTDCRWHLVPGLSTFRCGLFDQQRAFTL